MVSFKGSVVSKRREDLRLSDDFLFLSTWKFSQLETIHDTKW